MGQAITLAQLRARICEELGVSRWVVVDQARINAFAEVTGDAAHWRMTLQPRHWLVRWALKDGHGDREALAWLLLGCYARINEVFDDVTNSHEGKFQQAVADALVQGRLAVVRERVD